MFGFSIINILLFFVYPTSLISLSLYVSSTKETTVESYFFANHNADWFILGASMVAACFCSPYIFGLTYSGANTGLSIIYVVFSVTMFLLLGKFLIPRFKTLNINTFPEYFEKRFNRACKLYVSLLYILSNVFIRMLIMLVLGNIMLSTISGINAYSSLLFFLVVTGVYVIIGGLKAEFYVSIVQIIFIALSTLFFIGWFVFQGDGSHLVALKVVPLSSNMVVSWSELLVGLSIVAFWFTCADQFIVQKVLSVQNTVTVNKAVKLTGILQIIPVLIVVLPSAMTHAYSSNISNEGSLPALISSGILPDSLRGGAFLGAASIFMISIGSLFNSTSSLFTFDFYRSADPAASDRTLVLVGRLTTIALLFLSFVFIPICQNMNFDSCLALMRILMYLSAMISSVFIVSMLTKKIESTSIIFSLSVCTAIICGRVILENYYSDYPFTNGVILWLTQSTYLGFSISVFLISMGTVVISFAVSRIYNNLFSKNINTAVHKAEV